MDPGGTTISGEFRQRGAGFPITFERVEEMPRVSRPQDPTPPLPYLEEQVVFENAEAGVTLAGTLTVPPSGGPFPAVVMLTGSGAQNRDEELFWHRTTLRGTDWRVSPT